MLKLMNLRFASVLICLLLAVIVFHFVILLKIIPYTIAWGGRLQNDGEMYLFETISILINLLLIFLVCMKTRRMSSFLPMKVVNGGLWFFFGVFILNTVGNLFAQTTFEKCFSLLTALFAFLIWKLLRESEKATGVEK
jgi:hypothetical protein